LENVLKRLANEDEAATRQRTNTLRRALLRWYDRTQRDLPWRRSRHPYAIWVSEIMLQQTRVAVVVPYYERFMKRFPDVQSLAAAPIDDLLRLWAGLGYYSRARNLHRAAQQIVAMHGGNFPQSATALQALPGIGRYTAGAIGSIAFGQTAPIVDGNVIRVLSRLFCHEARVDTAAARTLFWDWATQWADCQRPGDANQALMELGATVCHRAAPDCDHCPVTRWCAARIHNLQEALPVRSKRPAAQQVVLAALLLRQRGRLLLVRRRQGRLLRDFWEMPTLRLPDIGIPTPRQRNHLLRKALRDLLHLEVGSFDALGTAQHSILQYRIAVCVLEGVGVRSAVARDGAVRSVINGEDHLQGSRTRTAAALENLSAPIDSRWATALECRALALTTLARKTLQAAARQDSTWEQYASHAPAKQSTRQRRDKPASNHP
jgi:A/G-specific adenine glycosylase